MATLSDLTSIVARTTGVPAATVFAYGRFAREAGLINQAGRGKGGATMTAQDAANLLMAIGGTAVTREAGLAISAFRSLRGATAVHQPGVREFFDFLLQRIPDGSIDRYSKVSVQFGTLLSLLIEQAASGQLLKLLKMVPVTPYDSDQWHRHRSMGFFSKGTIDEMVAAEQIRMVESSLVRVPEHVQLIVRFMREKPAAQIELSRMWGERQTVVGVVFSDKPIEPAHERDLEVECRISAITLMAIGHVLGGGTIPDEVVTVQDFGAYFQYLSEGALAEQAE